MKLASAPGHRCGQPFDRDMLFGFNAGFSGVPNGRPCQALKRPSDFVHKPAITKQQVHLRCLRRLLRCHSYHPVASPSLVRYSVQGPNANCPPNIRSSAGAATETSGAPRVQPEQEDASPIHAGKPPMVPSGKSQKMYSPLGVWPFDAGGGLARAQGATGSES